MSREKHLLSRRQFLKATGAAGLGSLMAPAIARGGVAESVVPKRLFGKTGVEVSCLGLGGMFDIPTNQIVLKQALNSGVTYWDTADCYGGGRSEKGIGKFFARFPEARKRVFLVSKSDDRDSRGMTRLLNRSLERMNTSYVDLYLVHGLSSIRELSRETSDWAAEAKAAGLVRFFGFSTHSNMEECMLEAARLGWIDGIMTSYNFRLMHSDRMKAAVAACAEAGIGLTAMKTQAGGPVRTDSETELELAGRFLARGFTDRQARLKAVWEEPNIACICSQMPNLTILMANVAAALDRTGLSTGERRLLQRYARETASSYCAGCSRICQAALAEPVPVAEVMRYLMYFYDYGDCERGRVLFARLPGEVRERLTFVDYAAAEARCPQRLPIGELMKEAGRVLA